VCEQPDSGWRLHAEVLFFTDRETYVLTYEGLPFGTESRNKFQFFL
jgi:hypothetical protein